MPPVGDASLSRPTRNHHYGGLHYNDNDNHHHHRRRRNQRMNLYRESSRGVKCDCMRLRSGNVDGLSAVKNISQQTKECACLFFTPPPHCCNKSKNLDLVDRWRRYHTWAAQSMGGRFFKDDGHGQNFLKKGLKVKIALRSAIAQRTFLLLLLFI